MLLKRMSRNIDDTLKYGREIIRSAEEINADNARRLDAIEAKIKAISSRERAENSG